MKQIRQSLFETNSSSTHSISFKFKKQQVPLSKLEIIDDTVIIYGIEQGDMYPVVSGENNKLDYIFTWMYIRDDYKLPSEYWNCYDDVEKRQEIENKNLWWPGDLEVGLFENQYKNLLVAIQRKYPEVKRICFKHAWYSEFDHQTGPYEEGPICDLDNPDDIYNYLFNDHKTVEIGHD